MIFVGLLEHVFGCLGPGFLLLLLQLFPDDFEGFLSLNRSLLLWDSQNLLDCVWFVDILCLNPTGPTPPLLVILTRHR